MYPPADIAKEGLSRIKQWLFDRREPPSVSITRVRLFFVGWGGAGKTTLAKLLGEDVCSTCRAVHAARPMREWDTDFVRQWMIKCAPKGASERERSFLQALVDALEDPDGTFLIDEITGWDEATVLEQTGGKLTAQQVK